MLSHGRLTLGILHSVQESTSQPTTQMYTVVHGGYNFHLVADANPVVSTRPEAGY